MSLRVSHILVSLLLVVAVAAFLGYRLYTPSTEPAVELIKRGSTDSPATPVSTSAPALTGPANSWQSAAKAEPPVPRDPPAVYAPQGFDQTIEQLEALQRDGRQRLAAANERAGAAGRLVEETDALLAKAGFASAAESDAPPTGDSAANADADRVRARLARLQQQLQ